jgi:hypothetical protein
MPPVPPGDNEGADTSEIEGVPPGYIYIQAPLHSAQFFNLDAYAKDCKRETEFSPDLLTEQ